MATQREYLVSLGLAQEGRGRFSRDATKALNDAIANGMTFSDCKVSREYNVRAKSQQKSIGKSSPAEIPVETVVVEFALPKPKFARKAKRLFGLTEEGHVVGFSHCRRCANFMSFCNCKTLLTPSIVATGLDGKPWAMVDCNTRPWKEDQA